MKKVIYRDVKNMLREATVFEVNEYVQAFTSTSYQKPVMTNLSGLIDASLIPAVPSSALQITKIADQAISKGDCVFSVNSSRVAIASYNNSRREALVQGIAMTSAQANEPVTFSVIGILTLPIFEIFNVNDVLYLDATGGLTNERHTDGYLVPVAKSLGSGSIMVQIGYPAKVGGA